MKKLLSVLLSLALLSGVFCLAASADEGVLFIDENFTSENDFYSNFYAGNFFIEDGLLYGYGAKTFQTHYDESDDKIFLPYSPGCWLTYDTEVLMSIAEDEFYDVDNRHVCLSYCNDNLVYEGRSDGRVFYNFAYSVPNGEFYLSAGDVATTNEDFFITAPVPYEICTDGTEFFTLGMSVSEGRIRCFYNGELVIDFVDTANEHLISKTIPSPFLLWNTNNFIQIKNVKIASNGYLYPLESQEETTLATEAPVVDDTNAPAGDDTNAPAGDDTNAPAGDDTNAPAGDDTNAPAGDDTDAPAADGTDAPAADNTDVADTVGTTGTQKPSTSTGDASLAVIIAMVAAIGSALIVRRVRN